MKLLRLVSLLLPCAIAHKNPAQHAGCLDSGLVQTLADGFGVLISNWSGAPDYSLYLANRIIHPDIEDYNESIKTLVTNGCATGTYHFLASAVCLSPLPLLLLVHSLAFPSTPPCSAEIHPRPLL